MTAQYQLDLLSITLTSRQPSVFNQRTLTFLLTGNVKECNV